MDTFLIRIRIVAKMLMSVWLIMVVVVRMSFVLMRLVGICVSLCVGRVLGGGRMVIRIIFWG